MSLPEIASSEVTSSSQDSVVSFNDIVYSLPPEIATSLLRSPASASRRLRENGISPVSPKGKALYYLASREQEIIAILSQIRPPVPDSIEKAGSVQAYEQQLAANHRRSDGEFVPTMDETIL